MNCACGTKLGPCNKRGFCMPCLRSRKCDDCGTAISERSTGRCRQCANVAHNPGPERRLKQSATMKRIMSDPLEQQRRVAAWKVWHNEAVKDPAYVARQSQLGRDYGARNLRFSRGPESRAKAGKRASATKLRHIPLDQQPLYRELRAKGIPAAEAAAMVCEAAPVIAAREAAEVRRRMGNG